MIDFKMKYTKSGEYISSPIKEFTASCNKDITLDEINQLAINNGDNFDKKVGVLPNCSQIIIMCNTYTLVCLFDCSLGDINVKTKIKEGKWKLISKIDFITI